MINTVIFDMHGVILTDPHGNLVPYIHSTRPDVTEKDIYANWMKAAVGELNSHDFFANLGYDNPAAAEAGCIATIEIDPSFFEVVTELRKQYRTVLLSNEIAEWGDAICDKFGLHDHFDLVVISGAVGMKKPEARIFEHVLTEMGAAPEQCVFIDDMTKHLDSARALGIHTIHYKGTTEEYPSSSSLAELSGVIAALSGD